MENKLVSSPTMAPSHCPETTRMSQRQGIEGINPHHLDISRVASQIETYHDDEVSEHQDAAFEVIAFAFTVDVAEQKDAKNHGNHIPLRENEVECMVQKIFRIDVATMHSAE